MLTLGVVAGLFTAGVGIFVLVKGECPLTDTIYLEGRQAKIAGVVTVVLGLSLVIFCTVPWCSAALGVAVLVGPVGPRMRFAATHGSKAHQY